MNTKKTVIIVGSVVAALLVGVIVALFLVLGEMQRQNDEAAYRDCMARAGFARDEPLPAFDDRELSNEYIRAMIMASERCRG